MIDVTLQIVGTESNVPAGSGKHLSGGIVGVYPLITMSASPNSRLVFVHVTGVPIADITKLAFLVDRENDATVRNRWVFDKTLASEEGLAALELHRGISITWDRAKQILKNVITGNFIVDGDII